MAVLGAVAVKNWFGPVDLYCWGFGLLPDFTVPLTLNRAAKSSLAILMKSCQ